jgi:hypothetical protein
VAGGELSGMTKILLSVVGYGVTSTSVALCEMSVDIREVLKSRI